MAGLYRMEYDASTAGDDSMPVVWEKTLDELLTPNGEESLLDFMLRVTDQRGGSFRLTRIGEA